jgi:cell division protein ZapA (FtsZ GTPase activity inhibitor)
MPIVSFVLRNKVYNIACDDGEEERIKKLADSLNNRLNEMSKNFGSASDNVILAFTAITMEDEIFSMKNAKITHESLEKTPSTSLPTHHTTHYAPRTSAHSSSSMRRMWRIFPGAT